MFRFQIASGLYQGPKAEVNGGKLYPRLVLVVRRQVALLRQVPVSMHNVRKRTERRSHHLWSEKSRSSRTDEVEGLGFLSVLWDKCCLVPAAAMRCRLYGPCVKTVTQGCVSSGHDPNLSLSGK